MTVIEWLTPAVVGDVNPETVRVAFSDSSGGRALSSFELSGLALGAPQVSELPGCSTIRSRAGISTSGTFDP